MRNARSLSIGVVFVVALAVSAGAQTPVGTAFTYQGRLTDSAAPANGIYDLRFLLYTAEVGGNQVGPILIKEDVSVTDSFFTVSLDFESAAFTGDARWLEAAVRPGASLGAFTTLGARQELTPTPNAIQAPWSGVSGKPAGFADGVDNDSGTVTSITAGTGLTGGTITSSGTIGVDFGTTGNTAAAGNHNHFGQSWSGSSALGLWVTDSLSSGEALYGLATSTSGENVGVHGESASMEGFGLYGSATASTGVTHGVYGRTDSTSGRGVSGVAFASAGASYGVYGSTNSSLGRGVDGESFATSGVNSGVYGRSLSYEGIGVYGLASSSSGGAMGVHGRTYSPYGYGVFGVALAPANANYGVRGESVSSTGYGVSGLASATTGANYGVYGQTNSAAGYAGYFQGNVHVNGTLSKSGGDFRIDHPLDPENKYLHHSFVESPDMMNIYNGNVVLDADGAAAVELPEWFEALNSDFRYQLTCIGGFAPVFIAEKISGGRFRIEGGTPGLEVSWQVTGIRKDAWAEAHRIPVEQDKPDGEKGTYLHPDVFGQPKEMGLDYKRHPRDFDRLDPLLANAPPEP